MLSSLTPTDPSLPRNQHRRSATTTTLAAEATSHSPEAWAKDPSLAVSPRRKRVARMMAMEAITPFTRIVEVVLPNQLPADRPVLPSLLLLVCPLSPHPGMGVVVLLAISATTPRRAAGNHSEGHSRTSTRTTSVPIPTPRASGISVVKRRRRDSSRPLLEYSRVTLKRGTRTDRDETRLDQFTKVQRAVGQLGPIPTFDDPTRCMVVGGAATTRATTRTVAIS